MKRIINFVLFSLLMSCGTSQMYLPISPLNKGKVEVKAGIGYSFSRYSAFSLQVGWNIALTDRDVLGIVYCNSYLPSHFAYGHYFNNKDQKYIYNAEVHIGNFLFQEYNPDYQIKLGVSQNFDYHTYHRISMGLNYFGNLLIRNNTNPYINYSLSYQFQKNDFQTEVNYNPGLTKFYLSRYTQSNFSKIIEYNRIDSFKIEYDTNNIMNKITITYDDSLNLKITKYPNGYSHIFYPGYKTYITKYNSNDKLEEVYIFDNQSKPHYCLLNLNQIISDLNLKRNIIITNHQDIFLNSLKNIQFIDDIDIGISIKRLLESFIRNYNQF